MSVLRHETVCKTCQSGTACTVCCQMVGKELKLEAHNENGRIKGGCTLHTCLPLTRHGKVYLCKIGTLQDTVTEIL